MVTCKDCGKDTSTDSNCCDSCAATWTRGYEQGAREVMSEVEKRDPQIYQAIARKFPVWRLPPRF